MPTRVLLFTLAALVALTTTALGCEPADLRVQGAPPASHYLEAFDGKAASRADLGEVRLRSAVCDGIPLDPPGRPLDADDFVAFAKTQGLDTRVLRARPDLVFVDIVNAGTTQPVRFRIAVLATSGSAGNELHTALRQHGQGAWGLHRANLAVLAPRASTEDAIVLASKLRLACWGVLMIAGLDDTFVVPGGYTEL